MTSAVLQRESPDCNPGLFAGFSKTSLTDGVFLRQGAIQMRDDPSRSRNKSGHVQVTPEEMRARCAFRLQRMAVPETADDGRRKTQFNKLARLTGLGVRRVEKLFRGYVLKPLAHECETIERAYCDWLLSAKAKAIADLREIEIENERLAAVAHSYASERWARACKTGAEDRAMGGEKAPATSGD